MVAGGGLCDEAVTHRVASQAREMIAWLTANGVAFTPDPATPGGLHLAREGGHSRRRVVHATDATGHAVQTSLLDKVRAHPNIDTFEQHVAIDLITGKRAGGSDRQIHGAYALNKGTGEVETFAAGHTVLATGGAGKVYLYTTNPDTSTGDGIAMAWRAGCRVANLEFVQFHPTCLFHPHAKSFLITEAVRGEGGHLLLPDGSRFMQSARRTRRTRAARRGGARNRLRDEKTRPRLRLPRHQPQARRIRPRAFPDDLPPLPRTRHRHHPSSRSRWCLPRTTPAAASSPTWMRAPICAICMRSAKSPSPGCTAPTGWRRIRCSNAWCSVTPPPPTFWPRPPRPHSICRHGMPRASPTPDEEVVISHNWDELRRFMWDYVGIVRTNKRLVRAAHRIRLLRAEIDEFYRNFRVSNDLIELRNLVQSADLIIRSAQLRQESRGLHFSRDYPDTLPIAGNTVLNPRPGTMCPSVCGVSSAETP